MTKLLKLTFAFLMLACMTACSDDDDPKTIEVSRLTGTWYVTRIQGWEYDSDEPGGKYKFDETFDYNGQGIPVGDNADEARKIEIQDDGIDYVFIKAYSYPSGYWYNYENGDVKLEGNQLVDGTMRVTIKTLTATKMVTNQKDSDGETTITYTKLD